MKLQFDAKQSYQIDAVNAVVDLFDGQPLSAPDYATLFQTFDTELFGSVGQTDLGIGNRLTLDGEAIRKNLRRVQERNDLEVDEHLEPHGFGANAPDNLWVQHDARNNTILIHVLDLVDEDEWIQLIKHRYERLLMEIFE